MSSIQNNITTERWGEGTGTKFDHELLRGSEGAVQGLTLYHNPWIYGIQVKYSRDTSSDLYGSTEGVVATVMLDSDKYIISVHGTLYDDKSFISSLSFRSNKGKLFGPFGDVSSGTKFSWDANDMFGHRKKGMGLLYFKGAANGYVLTALQATFGPCSSTTSIYPKPQHVSYESLEDSESQSKATLSRFARGLMSPVVHLIVGDELIEFHALEESLCQLEFFRAALKGSFLEASTKAISLPEDSPEVVAALIQFLYIGKYTYTYHDSSIEGSLSDGNEPACDLREGTFHASVFELATKYGYKDLAEAAVRGVEYVLSGIDGIAVVKLLKEGYERGLELYSKEANVLTDDLRARLPGLVKGLFETNAEEMRSIAIECPELGSDLLRAVIGATS